MALTKMTDDLNIIKKLDNEPNDVGGLTPEVLKSTFDKGPNKIKNYINDTLIPETEDKFEELEGEGRTIETIKKNADNIDKNKKDIDDLQANKADKKTTYTKLEIDGLNSDLQHNIENNENNISKLNNDKADKSNTYTKKEIDDKDTTLQGKIKSNEDNISSLCDGKADKSNTYTKGEVDSKNQDLQDKIGKNITDITSLKNNKADKSKVNQNSTNISNHIKSSSAHTANNISYSGKVPNTNNVSGALDSLQEDVNNFASGGTIEEVIHSRKDVDGHTHKNLKTHLDTWESKIKDNEKNLNESKEFRLNPTNSNASVISYPDNTKGLFNPEVKGIKPIYQSYKNGDFSENLNEWRFTNVSAYSVVNNVATFTARAHGGAIVHSTTKIIINHNYLLITRIKADSNKVRYSIAGLGLTSHSGSGNFETMYSTFHYHKSGDYGFSVIDIRDSGWTPIEVEFAMLIDLTQNNLEDKTLDELKKMFNHYHQYGLTTPALSYDFVSRGKNILLTNISDWERGNYYLDGQKTPHNGRIRVKNLIFVKSSIQYSVKNIAPYHLVIREYDINQNFINSIGQIPTTFETSENTVYIGVALTLDDNTTMLTNVVETLELQIEEGDTATSYESYISTKTGFSAPRPLISIGDVYDEINSNGELIYRISNEVDLGKVSNVNSQIGGDTTNYYGVNIENIKDETLVMKLNNYNGIVTSDYEAWKTIDGFSEFISAKYSSTIIYFKVPKTIGDFNNEDVIKWLKENKITLHYQLKEPEVIQNGQQGFKAPNPLPAYQNGDLVVIPKHHKKYLVKNGTSITLDEEICDIDFVRTEIDGEVIDLDCTLDSDGKTITIPQTTGLVDIKGTIPDKNCLYPIIEGNVPANLGTIVGNNTLSISDLMEQFNRHKKEQNLINLEMDYRFTIIENA